MLPTVSVVIPARNEEKVIKNCIESLLKSNYPKKKLEIVALTDRTNTDKTLEICKKYEPRIKVIVTKPTKSKAEAINIVLPKLKGEIMAIYDADCIVEKNCIKNAVKRFSDKEVIGVRGTIKSYNKKQNIITRALAIETSIISFTEHFLQNFGEDTLYYGKNTFIRRKILINMKGFDPKCFAEDNELAVRLRKHNHKIVFEPKAITWHEEPINLKSFFKQRTRWARGTFNISKKYNNKLSFKEKFFMAIHGIYLFITLFFSILLILLPIFLIFNASIILLVPFLLIIIAYIYFPIRSHAFYKEPLRDILFLPVFFVLSIFQLIIFIKSFFDENANKKIEWFRADRSGRVFK